MAESVVSSQERSLSTTEEGSEPEYEPFSDHSEDADRNISLTRSQEDNLKLHGLNRRRKSSRVDSLLVKDDSSPLLKNIQPRSPLDRLSRITDYLSKFYFPALFLVFLVLLSITFFHINIRLYDISKATSQLIEGKRIDQQLHEKILFLEYLTAQIQIGKDGLQTSNHFLGPNDRGKVQTRLEKMKTEVTGFLQELSKTSAIRMDTSQYQQDMALEERNRLEKVEKIEFSMFYWILCAFAALPAVVLIIMQALQTPPKTTIVRRPSVSA